MSDTIYHYYRHSKKFILLFLLCLICGSSYAQSLTTVRGIVKDAVTKETLPFATIQFNQSSIATFSDEEGEFRLTTATNHTTVVVTMMGYKPYTFTVQPRIQTTKTIYLESDQKELDEVVVKPKKEKYSKKNNPAVELIKKVIAHKKENNISALDYYQYKEYERVLFAFNEFKPDQNPFKHYKFLPNYVDSSFIDSKAILPFSIREKVSDVFYRKNPKDTKRIVKGYKIEGLDQTFDTEGLDAIIKEVFKDVSVYDNSITLLLHEFIGPLNEHASIHFYRWYISDTVSIDNDRFVKLDFAPFNSRDIGFTGNLYVSLDSMYAVKKAVIRTPKKMNINFVEELILQHDFVKSNGKWIPQEERMAIDISMLDAVKFYIDKTRTYEKFEEDIPMDPIFVLRAPEVCEENYLKRPDDFWWKHRPLHHSKDYRIGEMMDDINDISYFRILLKAGSVISSGYIPLSGDPETNKLDIGTIPTFYSYNSQEGNRMRLTLGTTKNLHPNLYFYGYGAYGTRDREFKYYGEATWAFKEIENHKDEFPKNNLTVAYKYDINTLGQRFTQAERDNIFMSLTSSSNKKLTYNRQTQISYNKEYYNGFSFKISGQTFDETPAGNLVFEKRDDLGNVYHIDRLKTTEASLALRYAPNEKFFQQRRKRHSIPSQRLVFSLSHTMSFDNLLGGDYSYNKTSFSVYKRLWVPPFGKLTMSAQVEKIWGETPFPFLITPSANNSYTIQNGSFYLLESLEFMHDAQLSWEAFYHMEGWLFNRIPLLKHLKWREIVGFRGFIGRLSKRNNPEYNKDLLLFPENSYTTGKTPYMEYNVGIENIFRFFRVDYVRRLNYLDHPDVNKDGIRISFKMNF